jgi:membrane protease YdiL (CAAX protease family)
MQSQQIPKVEVLKKILLNPIIVLISSIAVFTISQFVGVFIATKLFNGTGNANLLLTTYAVFSSVSLLLFLFITKKILNFEWSALGVKWSGWKGVFATVPALFSYFVISLGLTYIATKIIPGFKLEQAQDVGFKDIKQSSELVMSFLALVVFTPIMEELVFRGMLFKGLNKRLPFWISAIAASLVFATLHGQWNVAVDTFALSLILCYLVKSYDSILPTIFLHAIKNSIAFSLLFIFK